MSTYIGAHISEFIPSGVGRHSIASGFADPTTRDTTSFPPNPDVLSVSSSTEERCPSVVTVDDIRVLVLLDTAMDTLLALEPPKVPLVLDLLQSEVRTKVLDYEYRRKCRQYLHILVDKHHIMPPSLFVKEVAVIGQHPLNGGGSSDIYKGTMGSRSVCLKVLRTHVQDDEEKRDKDLRDFYKEALLWTHLNHPNLLPFLGVNDVLFPQRLCLVSPWMANGQITKFLELNPNHDRLRAISEVAAGIVYLHSRKIVHGDIKGVS
ncbi:kinase-like protein [Marasmius fiardii PR-910]|nr:kinase-like protein [Marasmius fiardii PR-910]